MGKDLKLIICQLFYTILDRVLFRCSLILENISYGIETISDSFYNAAKNMEDTADRMGYNANCCEQARRDKVN